MSAPFLLQETHAGFMVGFDICSNRGCRAETMNQALPYIIVSVVAFFGSYVLGAFSPFGFLLFVNLCVLAIYDWRERRLPNLLTATLAITAGPFIFSEPFYRPFDHLIGGLVGLLVFPIINVLYKAIRGRDGIGMGDAKLLGALGLWFAWPSLPFLVLIGASGGLVYALLISVTKKGIDPHTQLPFGSFLCISAWLMWLTL